MVCSKLKCYFTHAVFGCKRPNVQVSVVNKVTERKRKKLYVIILVFIIIRNKLKIYINVHKYFFYFFKKIKKILSYPQLSICDE